MRRKNAIGFFVAVIVAGMPILFLETPASLAEPAPRADPVPCDIGPPTSPNPNNGGFIGGTGSAKDGRKDHKDAIRADLSATCTGNYNIFFKFRITRARDGKTWDGNRWLVVSGADCTRSTPCTRYTQSTEELLGGSFTGNDTYSITFLDATGYNSGQAQVFPSSTAPWGIPTGPALQLPQILSIPALL